MFTRILFSAVFGLIAARVWQLAFASAAPESSTLLGLATTAAFALAVALASYALAATLQRNLRRRDLFQSALHPAGAGPDTDADAPRAGVLPRTSPDDVESRRSFERRTEERRQLPRRALDLTPMMPASAAGSVTPAMAGSQRSKEVALWSLAQETRTQSDRRRASRRQLDRRAPTAGAPERRQGDRRQTAIPVELLGFPDRRKGDRRDRGLPAGLVAH